MKSVKIILSFFIATIFVITLSCKLKPFPEDEGNDGDDIGEKIEDGTDLFSDEENTGIYVFETNEEKYLSEYGYTLWTLKGTNTADFFEPLEAKIYKSSGNLGAGFGLIFCEQKVDEKDFMIAVLINTKGQYIAGKVTDGQFESLFNWKSSSYIKRGYGAINNVKISYENEDDSFLLTINGYEITRIKVSEPIAFKESKSGYVVVIDRGEQFPEVPVRVVFERSGE